MYRSTKTSTELAQDTERERYTTKIRNGGITHGSQRLDWIYYWHISTNNLSKDQIYSSETTRYKALQLFYIVITKVSPQLQGKRESTHAFSFNANREPTQLLFQAPTGVPSRYAHVSFAPLFKRGTGEKAANLLPFQSLAKCSTGKTTKSTRRDYMCRLVDINPS